MSLFEAILRLEEDSRLVNDVAAEMSDPNISDSRLASLKQQLALIDPASPLAGKVYSLVSQINNKIGDTASLEATREAARNMVFALGANDAVSAATYDRWSESSKARFEAIDPHGTSEGMALDADGKLVNVTVSNQDRRDFLGDKELWRIMNDQAISEDARKDMLAKYWVANGYEPTGPQGDEQWKDYAEKVKKRAAAETAAAVANEKDPEKRDKLAQDGAADPAKIDQSVQMLQTNTESIQTAGDRPALPPPAVTQNMSNTLDDVDPVAKKDAPAPGSVKSMDPRITGGESVSMRDVVPPGYTPPKQNMGQSAYR